MAEYEELHKDIRALGVEVRTGLNAVAKVVSDSQERIARLEILSHENERAHAAREKAVDPVIRDVKKRLSKHDDYIAQLRGMIIAVNSLMGLALILIRLKVL